MRIIIVGAGISGLSMALHFRKHLPATVLMIVEGHDSANGRQDSSPSTFSGGLGVEIGPNGMRVLRRLSPSLHQSVVSTGYPVDNFEMRTAGGTLLGKRTMASDSPTIEKTIMIGRRDVWNLLKKEVERQCGEKVIREGHKVRLISQNGNEAKVVLQEGKILTADLVVGADGVRSAARKAVIDEDDGDGSVEFHNSINLGGLVPTEYIQALSNHSSANFVMTFGRSGFFGYTPCTTRNPSSGTESTVLNQCPGSKSMWWSTLPDSSSELQRTTANNPDDPSLAARLERRHGDWADPVIQGIIKDVAESGLETSANPCGAKATLDVQTPTWIVRRLARWAKDRVVLIGDAAHALPSISAQGVSQALEDSATLALLLAKSPGTRESPNDNGTITKLREVARTYESLRRPRVERILNEALETQSKKTDLGWLGRKIMYISMWLGPIVGIGGRDTWKHDYDVEEAIYQIISLRAHL